MSLLEEFEARVAKLRADYAAGDLETRKRLLQPAHSKARFENYDPESRSLSDADARLLIANEEGYAFWSKYQSYLYLDAGVQRVIAAVRSGDLSALREILSADPAAANPHWIAGFAAPKPIPNDSIPLFCVSEAVFRRTNVTGNEYELTQALLAAGADALIEDDIVLSAATSFNAIRVAEALLDGGVPIDGVDGDGVPIGYAIHFGHREIAELFARRGAKLDLRFAAGLGRMDLVQSWFLPDGSLGPGAGALADPYGQESKYAGESPFRCERTRANILSQALGFASRNGHAEVAEYLISQGAPVDAVIPGLDFEATPIRWAYWYDQAEMVHLLSHHAGIFDAVWCDLPDRVGELLEHDSSLARARDEQGRTPLDRLHGGLKHGLELARLLVKHGAHVTIPPGARALPDVVAYLRSAGATAE